MLLSNQVLLLTRCQVTSFVAKSSYSCLSFIIHFIAFCCPRANFLKMFYCHKIQNYLLFPRIGTFFLFKRVYYVSLWIKYGFVRFPSHCILLIFPFDRKSHLFQSGGCRRNLEEEKTEHCVWFEQMICLFSGWTSWPVHPPQSRYDQVNRLFLLSYLFCVHFECVTSDTSLEY